MVARENIKIKHPKTGKLTSVPERNKLQAGIASCDGKITDIGAYTHKAIWADSGISGARYCNVCGQALFYGGAVQLEDGTEKKAKICACGAWLGFFDKEGGE